MERKTHSANGHDISSSNFPDVNVGVKKLSINYALLVIKKNLTYVPLSVVVEVG